MTYHVQFPGLGLEFTLDRVAFTVFGMPIYWYGILIATGLALAIVFAFSHARRFGIDSDRMVDVIHRHRVRRHRRTRVLCGHCPV